MNIAQFILDFNTVFEAREQDKLIAANALLNKYKALCQGDEFLALQYCLKAFNIPFEGDNVIELREAPYYKEFPNPSAHFGEYFNSHLYQQAHALCAFATLVEGTGEPQEHATKLAVIFNDTDAMMQYFLKQAKNAISTKETTATLIHDACQFALPNFQAPGFMDVKYGCDFDYWKKLANQTKSENMMRKDFKELLPFAFELQKHVRSKKDKPNNEKIKILIPEINQLINRLNELERRKAKLTDEEKLLYGQLTKFISDKLCLLADLSGGKKIHQLTLLELKAFYETYKLSTEAAYKIFLDHFIPAEFFAMFKKLERVDDDEKIPPIVIDGRDFEQPGCYLMKVPVLDEMSAAFAACMGKETNCCQSLSGEAGQSCVIHGLTSPYGGFYVVFKGDIENRKATDELQGMTWAWRSKSGAIVLDSIEKTANGHNATKILMNQLAQHIVKNGYAHKVACGTFAGISSEFGVQSVLFRESFVDYDQYCDSREQRIIIDVKKPYLFYRSNEQAAQKTREFIENILLDDNLEANRDFVELLNWALITNYKDLIEEVVKLSAKSPHKEKVEQIIKTLSSYLQDDKSRKELLQKIDDMPYLSKLITAQGNTALMCAIDADLSEVALKLINMGANVNERNIHCNPALLFAMDKGSTEVALKLIDMGANINGRYSFGVGMALFTVTALGYALQRKLTGVTRRLIEKGAKIDVKDSSNCTPLHSAAFSDDYENALMLIDKGVKIDEKDNIGQTALMKAAHHGHKEIVILLIEKGANVNEKDNAGNTALMLAASAMGNVKKDSQVLLPLIAKGADINEKNKKGETALMCACDDASLNDIAMKLIELGAKIDEKDNIGRTPLMIACRYSNFKLAFELIAKGAKIDEKDNDGRTALVYASHLDNDHELVRALRAKAAEQALKSAQKPAIVSAADQTSRAKTISLLANRPLPTPPTKSSDAVHKDSTKPRHKGQSGPNKR